MAEPASDSSSSEDPSSMLMGPAWISTSTAMDEEGDPELRTVPVPEAPGSGVVGAGMVASVTCDVEGAELGTKHVLKAPRSGVLSASEVASATSLAARIGAVNVEASSARQKLASKDPSSS